MNSKIDEIPAIKDRCPYYIQKYDVCARHVGNIRCGLNGNNTCCIYWPYTEEGKKREKNNAYNGE